MDNNLIYVYCVTGHACSPTPELEGVRCLHFGDLYAITQDVSPEEFSEESLKKNFADLAWIEAHTREHIRIISEVMRQHPAIPFKFGAIFNTEASIERFIKDYEHSLLDNLCYLGGKEEWSVKIFCNYNVLDSKIGELSDEVRNLDTSINESTPGKAFILRRKKAVLIENEKEKIIRNSGQQCYDSLVTYSEQNRINNLLPREVTDRTDDMILNTTYFIEEQKVSGFLNTANELQGKFKNTGFDIEVSGPWPPFTFVSVK